MGEEAEDAEEVFRGGYNLDELEDDVAMTEKRVEVDVPAEYAHGGVVLGGVQEPAALEKDVRRRRLTKKEVADKLGIG